MEDYLKLDQQLCFSVYVLHREIMQQYRPILESMGITYPQYITMMALWEEDNLTVNQLGDILQLDNGTITPLLKRLEAKNFLTRNRCAKDERVVKIRLTDIGRELKSKAASVPIQLFRAMHLDLEEMKQLKDMADKICEKAKSK